MTEPIRILTGARLRTPDAVDPGVDAVAWWGSRIVAIGATAELTARWPDATGVDVAGAVVTPGFVDTHLHPMPMCFFEAGVDLSGCTSLDEVLDAIADRSRSVAEGEWVFAQQLDDEALVGKRLPDRSDLDRAAGGRPTVVLRRDGHHAIGSSAALAASGITAATPDPPGGVIHRAGDGTPTGLCGEAASSLLLDAMPTPPWERFETALDRVIARLVSHGVTGISAICQTSREGPAGAAGALEAVAWSALLDRVPFDVQTILIGADACELVDQMADTPLHDPARRRRLDGVKLFLDGTFGGHTACLHHPFADAPGSGMLTSDPDDAYAWAELAHLAGRQICVHAIGDAATAEAVRLFTRLADRHPGTGVTHRIEHASLVDPATIEAMADLGVAAVVQPMFIASERDWLAKRLGDRVESVYPFRSFLDAGVVLAGSSDAPIEEPDVLGAMWAAVDRHGIAPTQALTPDEALEAYTTGPARVRGTAERSGRLAEGFDADLVVASDVPGTTAEVTVRATIAAGRVVHRDAAAPAALDAWR